jgi:hypothetical protein
MAGQLGFGLKWNIQKTEIFFKSLQLESTMIWSLRNCNDGRLWIAKEASYYLDCKVLTHYPIELFPSEMLTHFNLSIVQIRHWKHCLL